MNIADLHRENRNVVIAGDEYILSAYTLEMQIKIAKHFQDKGREDGLNYAMAVLSSGVLNEEFINVVIDVIYLLIVNPQLTLEGFKKKVGNKVRVEDLTNILIPIITDADPIIASKEAKDSKKKMKILGFITIIFSLIGLIATTYWLAVMVIGLMNS
jgi:hypothetical protein